MNYCICETNHKRSHREHFFFSLHSLFLFVFICIFLFIPTNPSFVLLISSPLYFFYSSLWLFLSRSIAFLPYMSAQYVSLGSFDTSSLIFLFRSRTSFIFFSLSVTTYSLFSFISFLFILHHVDSFVLTIGIL